MASAFLKACSCYIVLMNPLSSEFDGDYFKDYGETWLQNSYLPLALESLGSANVKVRTALILGCATGETLLYLQDKGIKPKGIEISSWACERVHSEVKSHVTQACISKEVPRLADKGYFFDFVFSSSLQYLPEKKIHALLPHLKGISKYFCHYGGFKGFGDDELDLRLKTLKEFSWWKEIFKSQGWNNSLSPYIWSLNK